MLLHIKRFMYSALLLTYKLVIVGCLCFLSSIQFFFKFKVRNISFSQKNNSFIYLQQPLYPGQGHVTSGDSMKQILDLTPVLLQNIMHTAMGNLAQPIHLLAWSWSSNTGSVQNLGAAKQPMLPPAPSCHATFYLISYILKCF